MLFLTGKEICDLRGLYRLNLREFAVLVGVAEATVCRWERDKRRPRFEMMRRLNELAEAAKPVMLIEAAKKSKIKCRDW